MPNGYLEPVNKTAIAESAVKVYNGPNGKEAIAATVILGLVFIAYLCLRDQKTKKSEE